MVMFRGKRVDLQALTRKYLFMPGIAVEEIVSRYKTRQQSQYAEDIERAFIHVERLGGGFRGWALTKSAIRSFCANLLSQNSSPNIVELGGGQSTLFWKAMTDNSELQLKVSTFEHHPQWAGVLQERVSGAGNIKLNLCKLRRVSNEEWAEVFTSPVKAKDVWKLKSIDGMVVDGPHGNGRSLVFPLFYECFKPNAWLLIDDFDHYPFLNDLSLLFRYRVVDGGTAYGKRWVLVQLGEPV